MNLIKIFRKLKTPFQTQRDQKALLNNSLTPILLFTLFSLTIWFGTPYIIINNAAPLAQPEKRLYIIACIFLLWLLKFLLIDLDNNDPLQYKDPNLQNKLQALQKRFLGALDFLKKTTASKHGTTFSLNNLPWYLLIGPSNSGKTTLLANSSVHFILQKQFHQHIQQIEASDSMDFWITRDACIIDVPGKYISGQEAIKSNDKKINIHLLIWRYFLSLIKKHRGNRSLHGILIALPLPEFIKNSDQKKYQWMLRNLFERLAELQKTFNHPIPCHIVVTKCDLLSGFTDFFGDNTDDEITQSWGIALPTTPTPLKLDDIFATRFHALLKRLNQQLIWRLHQERNPLARPQIKDFPLQLEKLKECLIDVVKKFTAEQNQISLQGIYLTSALQAIPDTENIVLDDAINSSQRGMQIFQAPNAPSRAYFIKHFISHQIANLRITDATRSNKSSSPWLNRLAYASSALVIVAALFILGKDFQLGLNHTHTIQQELSDYQIAIQQFHNPEEHLTKTSELLDQLLRASSKPTANFSWQYITSFYSNQSQQKAALLYAEALQSILAPEIRDYLAEFLKNPVNRNAENVYTVLKCYLMLGDRTHFQANYILETLKQVLPQTLIANDKIHLIQHIATALQSFNSIQLNNDSIQETRKYLSGLPTLRLSYIILKNFENNNLESEIDFGLQKNSPIFVTTHLNNEVPVMFTAKVFQSVFTDQTSKAADEAMNGNWVLGKLSDNNDIDAVTTLTQQLRQMYVNNYIDIWETLLANINVANAKNLEELDTMIVAITSDHSPLLELLQTFYDNTYFEPVISSSPKLQTLGILLDKNNHPNNQLYQIFSGLNALHEYIQSVLTSSDRKKTAFGLMSHRVKNLGAADALTQIRFIATKTPDPVRLWLEKIANDTWHLLMQESTHYIDLSWQNEVVKVFQSDIANQYPFTSNTNHDLALQKFINFFGNPGVITNFYNHYLVGLIDTSKPEWHWKNIDNDKLPFSDETLQKIREAMNIHHVFFPNDDKKLSVQFSLQPYLFDKQIKSVKLSINDKQIIDERGAKNPHQLEWPNSNKLTETSLQLTLNNQKMIHRHFPGDWGWFRLLNQSFESSISRKETLLNFSENDSVAKYILSSKEENPFFALNLQHFRLPNLMSDNTNKDEA